MDNAPETKAEAEAYHYGSWGAIAYDPKRCAYEFYDRNWLMFQCSRKPGHGPDELYCKQHAKKVQP